MGLYLYGLHIIRYNRSETEKRMTPCSSFKICNTLIGSAYSFACLVRGKNLMGKDARHIVETILKQNSLI